MSPQRLLSSPGSPQRVAPPACFLHLHTPQQRRRRSSAASPLGQWSGPPALMDLSGASFACDGFLMSPGTPAARQYALGFAGDSPSAHAASFDVASLGMRSPPSAKKFAQTLYADEFVSLEGPDGEPVVLGRGVSAVVEKMARTSDGAVVAVKHIEAHGRQQKDAIAGELIVTEERREATLSTAAALDARHLVEMLGAFATPTGASIVMELMSGSFGGLPPMPEVIAASATRMFLRGLRFMHEDLRVMHRDLKPSNLLFDAEGTLKITDFGLSTKLASTTTDKFVGSMMYMSPERLRGEAYGFPGDIFSLGVTVAHLVLGEHPLADRVSGASEQRFWELVDAMRINDGLEASTAASESSFRAALEGRCSAALLDFILSCVHADPGKRPTCAELLRHDWFTAAPRDGASLLPWLQMH